MAAGISALSYALPDGILSHKELQDRFGIKEMDRLISNTGILSRRVCLKNECASDLAYRAAKKLFEDNDIDIKTIDFIIFSSQMPDYLLPTTACILQNRLGLSKSVGAIDINLGCSQYLYSHANAFAMVQSGLAKKVLVMTADTPSRIINPKDRSVVPLFGDGGTAAIIEDVGEGSGYQDFAFGTDGSEYSALIWPSSGMRERYATDTSEELVDKLGSIRSKNDMYMDGQKIFLFTLKTVPNTLKSFLEKNHLSIDDVDFFIFHQASKMIIDSITRKLKLPESKFNRIYENRGNSGGSTVGISLHHAIKDAKIKGNSKIVLSAFGVGLSWCHAILNFQDKLPESSAID
jgi:3-oxoacyl-[acyl-carrier-protein] synthase-3